MTSNPIDHIDQNDSNDQIVVASFRVPVRLSNAEPLVDALKHLYGPKLRLVQRCDEFIDVVQHA